MNEMKTTIEKFFYQKGLFNVTYLNGGHNPEEQEVTEVTITNKVGSLKIRITGTTTNRKYIATFKAHATCKTADVFFGLSTRNRDTIRFKVDDRQEILDDYFFNDKEVNRVMYETIFNILWGVGHYGDGWDIFREDVPEEFIITDNEFYIGTYDTEEFESDIERINAINAYLDNNELHSRKVYTDENIFDWYVRIPFDVDANDILGKIAMM